ncbi:hypothetical protein P153DRAFT_386609 [Dothidotthia symphoricarpi CBS 119687]|uniref:Uncharacterized protein n=1 Tax=Dothidotthia symphoricarpi CBS 119687 TaxID=1392245 RepID=A0A6A6A9K3_9PLEO|nr:uncharacterized protein P153DRAFT_386609 [Dothidotthia symphoricarpi CBS 119687]KAF2128490.1 hypothetical protein P153DRAFT_386609 [Dothidotthia symphoricarpi CBS 119687]
MFDPLPWANDPFPSHTPMHDLLPMHPSRAAPTHPRRHLRRRTSHFAIEGAEYTSQSDTSDAYYDKDASPDADFHIPSFRNMRPAAPTPFHRVACRMPARTAEALDLARDEVLVLPLQLTRLRVRIYSGSRDVQSVRAVVAGDMRVRDVVGQVVGAGDVRVYVKRGGRWVEPGAGVKMSGVVEQQGWFAGEEQREVEVKIEVGDGGGGFGRRFEREMERGVERMRMSGF